MCEKHAILKCLKERETRKKRKKGRKKERESESLSTFGFRECQSFEERSRSCVSCHVASQGKQHVDIAFLRIKLLVSMYLFCCEAG